MESVAAVILFLKLVIIVPACFCKYVKKGELLVPITPFFLISLSVASHVLSIPWVCMCSCWRIHKVYGMIYCLMWHSYRKYMTVWSPFIWSNCCPRRMYCWIIGRSVAADLLSPPPWKLWHFPYQTLYSLHPNFDSSISTTLPTRPPVC